ncbi:MAG: hypothetical protein WA446_20360, partial [Steroidobacteraceae bacterium]
MPKVLQMARLVQEVQAPSVARHLLAPASHLPRLAPRFAVVAPRLVPDVKRFAVEGWQIALEILQPVPEALGQALALRRFAQAGDQLALKSPPLALALP